MRIYQRICYWGSPSLWLASWTVQQFWTSSSSRTCENWFSKPGSCTQKWLNNENAKDQKGRRGVGRVWSSNTKIWLPWCFFCFFLRGTLLLVQGRVDIWDGQLRVNSKAITVAGANVHEMHPLRGKAITEEDMLIDIKKLMLNPHVVGSCGVAVAAETTGKGMNSFKRVEKAKLAPYSVCGYVYGSEWSAASYNE